MNWLLETITEPSMIQAVLILSVVSAVGVYLGKIKFFGVSLGVTFVFFAGILAGHLGIEVNKDMLNFAQNFGLIIFVYALGLQVGPGFFSSLKKGGVELNMMGLAVIVIGILCTLIFHWTSGISIPTMVGLLSGAVTNTPALGAAQQALIQMRPGETEAVTDMALACAVTYPLGVVGVILAIIVLRAMFAKKMENSHKEQDSTTFVAEFQVLNPSIYNKSIQEVMRLTEKRFVISRVWHEGKVCIPTSETLLREKDHLLVISIKSDVEYIKTLFGEQENKDWNKKDIDWNAIDSQLISRRIVVTRDRINGVKLGSLRLRNLYGINITRVNRAGIDLLASKNLRLQIGDRLTIVGEANSVNNVGKILGNEMKRLDNPNLLAIFVGLTLGVLIGAIPIFLPGMDTPIKLGVAGGPIIVGILMGAFGPRIHLTTYTTQSANLMMRQFGIVIYLAGLGIDSGAHFFETVFRAEGLMWIGVGFLLTIIPVLIVGIIASQFFKLDYAHNVGMLCGSMANPMALNYANTTVEGDEPSVSYATVYPLSMFIRVISAQLLISFFC
ncbi:MAG TPA: putative transporter [Candidatus Parabacteroides intestinipullorum]|uniref:Transporter n=1 Tax=Candidatus Parabacteroides intestinipullorum TaxID=2838723 RepID=A0A9D1XDG1_9BACT|nr:putative transporter [Candidatus Parabacteroides intestinipullorum]